MRRPIVVAVVIVGLAACVVVAIGGAGYVLLKQYQRADAQRQKDALARKLKIMDPELRIETIDNMVKGDAKDAVPALIAILAMPDEEMRLHAAMALGEIGEPAVPA